MPDQHLHIGSSVLAFPHNRGRRAPALRSSGYVIDFWGIGYDIAEKMGLLPGFLGKGYHVKNSVSSTTAAVVSRASEQKYLMILPEVNLFNKAKRPFAAYLLDYSQ